MPDIILDEINITTLPEINDSVIEDNFFLAGVLQAHLRAKCLVPFKGGAFTRNAFLHSPLNAGAYAKGIGGFNLTKPLTLGATVFDPRYYVCMIVEYLEDIDVLNVGDLSVFSLLETDAANAHQTISAVLELDMHKDGQSAARSISLNGWTEAYNDGIMPSYDGSVYTTYGTASRNGASIRKTLNGNVFWGGNSDGSAGSINYPAMNAMYRLACRGKEEPDLIVGNRPIITFIENRLQSQQRFGQDMASVRDPYWGAVGFRFKNAIVMQDDYFPSALPPADATNAGLGGNLTSTFAYVAPSAVYNNFPAANATLTVGEVLVMFNTGRLRMRISNSHEFGFNATPFLRDIGSTKVVSQLKAAVNLECTAPWSGVQSYGWNG